MVSDRIVLGTEAESGVHHAALRRSHFAMVQASLLRESAGLPAFHAGADHSDIVDRAAFDRNIASNGLEALAPKNLAGARHMLDAHKTVVVSVVRALAKRGSDQAQRRIGGKLFEQKRKVVRLESDVRIQAGDDLVRQTLHAGLASIER